MVRPFAAAFGDNEDNGRWLVRGDAGGAELGGQLGVQRVGEKRAAHQAYLSFLSYARVVLCGANQFCSLAVFGRELLKLRESFWNIYIH